MDVDPADFYTGIVADLYAPLRSSSPDPGPYERFVRRTGEPALELGCGDGDPLLALRRTGLDVEGVDSSIDMLERCRARAAAENLDVVLHHARMEAMDLGRRYRSIYLAGATFTLLPDDGAAAAALRCLAAHLEPGGRALVPLFVPAEDVSGAIGITRSIPTATGYIAVTPIAVERDPTARTHVTVLRYERCDDGQVESLERRWLLHWLEPDGFGSLVRAAGLTVVRTRSPSGEPVTPQDSIWTALLERPEEVEGVR